jgi:LysM repeat protein
MSDRGLPIVDGAPACPFVAFDDDRDGRSQAPDHRHRCFAEARPAPRALAHQEAYCLSSAFPVCPTFQDWARREAAATRSADSAPAAAPAPAPSQPLAADDLDDVPPMPPRRNPPRDWAAPPPWSGQDAPGQGGTDQGSLDPGAMDRDALDVGPAGGAAAGSRDSGSAGLSGGAAAGLAGSAAYRLAGPDPDEPIPARPVDDARGEAYATYGAVPGGPEAGRPGDDAGDRPYEPEERYAADDRAGAYGSYEQRGARRPSRSGSGSSGSRASASQARPAPARREQDDPSELFGPAWEHPRRYEAYPSLRTRVGLPSLGGIPRLGVAAIAVLVAALALFFVGPMLLGIGSNDGGVGAPTAAPSVESSATPAPTTPPEPTPQVYVVVKGDTFSKIAKRFGLTVEALQQANPQIKNINKIGIGDEITIPVPQASGVPDASEEVTSAP